MNNMNKKTITKIYDYYYFNTSTQTPSDIELSEMRWCKYPSAKIWCLKCIRKRDNLPLHKALKKLNALWNLKRRNKTPMNPQTQLLGGKYRKTLVISKEPTKLILLGHLNVLIEPKLKPILADWLASKTLEEASELLDTSITWTQKIKEELTKEPPCFITKSSEKAQADSSSSQVPPPNFKKSPKSEELLNQTSN